MGLKTFFINDFFWQKKKQKKNLKQNLNQGNNVEEIKALGKIKTVKLANKYVAYF